VKKGLFLILATILVAMLALAACSTATTTTTKPATSTAPTTTTSKPTTTAPTTTITTAKPTTTTGQPKYGGTLRLSRFTSEGPSVGDPLKHAGMNSFYEATPALETLLRADASGALIPWLATGYTVDVANKSITLAIRQGIKFHDGTPFNADAVRWNLQYRMDGKMAAMKSFASVTTTDPYTVKITLSSWDSTILGNLASGPGMMISPTNYLNNGADYAANNPVGTGPFIFDSWKKNDTITYVRNPNYWQTGLPYLDKIQWVTVPDMNTKAMSFQAGELDVVMTMDLPQIQTLNKAGFTTLHQVIGSGADGFVFSSANASSPWSNVKARQAAMYAINTKEYTTALFGDEAAPANQMVGASSWAYNKDIVGYPYDVTKAKALLTEAGFSTGFKSVIFGSQDPTTNKRALAIQDYLSKISIALDVQIISTAQSMQMYSNGVGWEGLIGDSLGQSTDLVDTMNRYYTGGGLMFASMATPQDYLDAMKKAVSAPDQATKAQAIKDAMKLFIDKYCLLMTLDTRYDNAFEQKYVMNSGILRSVNTQMWTPENAWINK
jgi:peptide/nickel transport system substrate-binding protein